MWSYNELCDIIKEKGISDFLVLVKSDQDEKV